VEQTAGCSKFGVRSCFFTLKDLLLITKSVQSEYTIHLGLKKKDEESHH